MDMTQWIVITIIALLLTILFFIICFFRLKNYKRWRSRKRKKGKGVRPQKKFVCITVVFMILSLISATSFGINLNIVINMMQKASSPEVEYDSAIEMGPDDEVQDKFTVTEPISSVNALFPGYFLLSKVQGSEMLSLFTRINSKGEFTWDALEDATQALRIEIEKFAHPVAFFKFYPGLEKLFPEGDSEDEFIDVNNLIESEKQIRGAGALLKKHLSMSGDEEKYRLIKNDSHHLLIRAKDALYFGKLEGVSDELMWVFAEIAFSAIINEYSYGALSGSDLSDWYYFLAQIFDYLGGLADTEDLILEMYFVSAVCYCCAYDEFMERNPLVIKGTIDRSIHTEYIEMLYRVALRVEEEQRERFFLGILQIEETSQCDSFPSEIRDGIQKKLNGVNYKLYIAWRDNYVEE